MRSFLVAAIVSIVGAWLVPAAALADPAGPVDNPAFAAWSRCAVGSSVTYHRSVSGQQLELLITKTLRDKTDDHVTLDVSTVFDMPNAPAARNSVETLKAKLDQPPDLKPLPDEQLQIGAKKIDCKVNEIDTKDPQGNGVKVKIWTNDDIPGGLVKIQVDTTDHDITATTINVLTSYNKK